MEDKELVATAALEKNHIKRMFVLPQYQGRGIGRLLLAKAEEYLKNNNCKYIIVKTLSDIVEYEPYERTSLFYKKVGFEELITLTEMWDSENPCLIMIKEL